MSYKTKVFFLPYAGASAFNYAAWKKYFSDQIEPYFIEFKGRGSRSDEGFYGSMEEAVSDVFREMKKDVDEGDYYIFGHSLGGLVAYELLLRMQAENFKMPQHVFISGRDAPEYRRYNQKITGEPDDIFLNRVSKYGGIPDALFQDREIRSLFLPILKADFRLLEEYQAHTDKVLCNLTVLYGCEDTSITIESVRDWAKYAGKNIDFVPFPGDHFYCFKEKITQEVVRYMENTIAGLDDV